MKESHRDFLEAVKTLSLFAIAVALNYLLYLAIPYFEIFD